MVPYLFRISVCFGLAGIVLGIAMGVRQDFTLMPAHAHVNLVGFVTMFLAALYYRITPNVAETLLARVQAIASVTGAIIFPIGIAAAIAEIAKFLKASPAQKLHIVGHTDNIGGFDFNIRLSQERANAVIADLVQTYGIDPSRLRGNGVGPLRLLQATPPKMGVPKTDALNSFRNKSKSGRGVNTPGTINNGGFHEDVPE